MNVTPEMIKARSIVADPLGHTHTELASAVQVLDNAGVFAAIDEVTGYDTEPESFLPLGDPSEMGDLVAKVSIASEQGPCHGSVDVVVTCTQHGEVFRRADLPETFAWTSGQAARWEHEVEHGASVLL